MYMVIGRHCQRRKFAPREKERNVDGSRITNKDGFLSSKLPKLFTANIIHKLDSQDTGFYFALIFEGA